MARINWPLWKALFLSRRGRHSCSALFAWAVDLYARRRETALPGSNSNCRSNCTLWCFARRRCSPKNLRPSSYGGWIGLLASRLTTISAIFGLVLLGCLKPRRWHLAGFGFCAVLFFAFLYQDTGRLNRLEANAGNVSAGFARWHAGDQHCPRSGGFTNRVYRPRRSSAPASGTASATRTMSLPRENSACAFEREVPWPLLRPMTRKTWPQGSTRWMTRIFP